MSQQAGCGLDSFAQTMVTIRDHTWITAGSRHAISLALQHSRFAPPTNPAYPGTEGGFYVEDNGEGNGTDDQLSRSWVGGDPGTAQATCDGATTIEFDASGIVAGNIQVH